MEGRSAPNAQSIHSIHSEIINMQVSVETPGGLERRMRVSVPSADFEKAVSDNLRRIGKHAKVDGFRPGKVPAKVLEQRYGMRARQDALSEILERTYPKALSEQSLQPAGQPEIEFESVEPGADLTYVATFDVYPQIEVQGIEGMSVKDASAEVTEADVDTLLQRLREQRKSFADKDGVAAEGDRVTIDFKGSIDGEEFAGGSAEGHQLELGAGQFLKELEDGIVGMAPGDSRDVPVTFPEDYHAEDLQGKTASFAVTLNKLESAELPAVDAEFCKQFGLEDGDEAALREKLRESMNAERDQALARYTKKQVMANILAANPIDVPKGLVAQEIERMRHDAAQRFGRGQQSHEELHKMLPDELFEEQARRRTQLGLVIGEIIRNAELKVDEAQVESKLKEIVSQFDDGESAAQYYRQDRNFMQSLRAMVLEDQVVQYCLDKASRESESLSFDELTQKASD